MITLGQDRSGPRVPGSLSTAALFALGLLAALGAFAVYLAVDFDGFCFGLTGSVPCSLPRYLFSMIVLFVVLGLPAAWKIAVPVTIAVAVAYVLIRRYRGR